MESLTNLRNVFLINIKMNYKIPEEEDRFKSSKPTYFTNQSFFPKLDDSHLLFQGPILDEFL